MSDVTKQAEAIARMAHEGQTEPHGRKRPYIEHVEAVVALVSSDEEKAVAWLHDVLEDTDLDELNLVEHGIPIPIIRSVQRLTHEECSYRQYIVGLRESGDAVAIAVKLADLRDHLHPSCPDRLRRRYEEALQLLTGQLT